MVQRIHWNLNHGGLILHVVLWSAFTSKRFRSLALTKSEPACFCTASHKPHPASHHLLTLRWQTWLENLPGMMMYDDFQRLNLRGYATGISVARGLFCRGLWGSDLCHRRPVKESTKHQWWSGGDTHKKTTLKSRSFYWTESSSIFYIYVILCVYIYIYMVPSSVSPPTPPMGWVPR